MAFFTSELLLRTLPGWPSAGPAPAGTLLLIMVVIPLVIGGIIFALGVGPALVQEHREQTARAGLELDPPVDSRAPKLTASAESQPERALS